MNLNELSYKVIGCAFEVHRQIGPGLLESAYQTCLDLELKRNGLFSQHEYPLHLNYKGIDVRNAYRIDLLVNDQIAIEIKSVESINDVHLAQMITYINLGKYPLGLLINFSEKDLKKGLRRIINSNIEQI